MTALDPGLTLPEILNQPWPAVRALQDRLLRRTIELCYEGHPYYSRLMRRERLEPRHIQGCDDLVRLPVTTKRDFLADPDAFRLGGPALTLEERTLWKVMYTTGTTSGAPAPIFVTTFDFYAYLFAAMRRRGFTGLDASDIVANLFPLTAFPMGAYARAPDEAAAVGAAMVFARTGRPHAQFPIHQGVDEAVKLVERHRATVLWGVAGFVRRMLVRAGEIGADLGAVRMAMITGEATSPAFRADMRRRMTELGCAGNRVINRYGSTEQGSSMVECVEGGGFHSLAPDQIFHEVVDPASGRRLPDGETGMLAFTHLIRRGTVLLRYAMGDVVSISHATCPHCGRTSPRISSELKRSGDIVKIKGTLVNLQALKDQLEQMPALDEYQIVIRPMDAADPLSMDELVIRLAAREERRAEAAAAVESETARTAHVRPRIEFVERDAIYDPAGAAKPRRILDLRPAAAAAPPPAPQG